MASSIRFEDIITIDKILVVRLHALSTRSVVIGFGQSIPVLDFSAHMSSAEARTLGRALIEYADMADQAADHQQAAA